MEFNLDALLSAFSNTDSINAMSNQHAETVLTVVIMTAAGTKLPEELRKEYEDGGFGWRKYEKDQKMHNMYGASIACRDSSGGYSLRFNEDISTIGFLSDHGFNKFKPNDDVKRMALAVVTKVKEQANKIVDSAVKKYLSQPRYGNIDYLRKEYTNFVRKDIEGFRQQFDVDMTDRFPVDFGFDIDDPEAIIDNLKEFLESHHGNMENFHVVK